MHIREHKLRRLAYERIQTGELPSQRPSLTRERLCSGERCALCGTPVHFDGVECLTQDSARSLQFHLTCHTVWVTASIV
jgi:hypothetical protein